MMRALFPALRRYAYLNAASSSPLATPVADAAAAFLRETQEHGDVRFPAWLAFKESLHEPARAVSQCARRAGGLHSLDVHGLSPRGELFRRRGIREVLTLEGEFPSTTIPFLNLGLRLRVVKPRPDGRYPVEDLAAALTPETGAVAVSAVQYGSGFMIDLEALATLKVPVALNVAQALGRCASTRAASTSCAARATVDDGRLRHRLLRGGRAGSRSSGCRGQAGSLRPRGAVAQLPRHAVERRGREGVTTRRQPLALEAGGRRGRRSTRSVRGSSSSSARASTRFTRTTCRCSGSCATG